MLTKSSFYWSPVERKIHVSFMADIVLWTPNAAKQLDAQMCSLTPLLLPLPIIISIYYVSHSNFPNLQSMPQQFPILVFYLRSTALPLLFCLFCHSVCWNSSGIAGNSTERMFFTDCQNSICSSKIWLDEQRWPDLFRLNLPSLLNFWFLKMSQHGWGFQSHQQI